jgi:NDP-sugar pyrophosphorylase family protein
MKVIVPAAGRSSRFPNMPPKWMLPDYDGLPMIVKATEGLRVMREDLIITILREHEERFNAVEGLRRAFGGSVQCVILDQPTGSQSETVVETLRQTALKEAFLVKDSDNYFELSSLNEPYNYVSVASLNDFDQINPRNKSYVQVDQEEIITNFREKKVISDLFSVGGYFFRQPEEFIAAYDELNGRAQFTKGELYLSEVISFMILHGQVFKSRRVGQYQDWGTIHEWRQKLERRRVFLISVDGFLFERGSRFFSPAFENVKPNPAAIEAVIKMAEQKHMIIYLSVRTDDMEEVTRAQIRSQGLPEGKIIFGCGIAQWAMLTSAHATLPFPTSQAAEIDPYDPNIIEKLGL